MNFGHAIEALKSGSKVSRSGWNGKGMWLALQVPDENSKMGYPYVYMSDVKGVLFPWKKSDQRQVGLLAAFRRELAANGWIEGKNLILDQSLAQVGTITFAGGSTTGVVAWTVDPYVLPAGQTLSLYGPLTGDATLASISGRVIGRPA